MQAAEGTNTLAIFARLHNKSKVNRNILIASSSVAGRRGRLVGCVKHGCDAVEQLSISVAIGTLGTQ
jgi:hypothetical protein